MPILDFQCLKCQAKFDELIFSHNRDQVSCPKCQSSEIKQIYEGKCLFGQLGNSSSSSSGCSGKSCSHCSGCH